MLFLIVFYSYESQEVALNCGIMLRECFRHEELARLVLFSDHFYKFFDYVELSTFDIASDAFSTFKVIRGQLTSSLVACANEILLRKMIGRATPRISCGFVRSRPLRVGLSCVCAA